MREQGFVYGKELKQYTIRKSFVALITLLNFDFLALISFCEYTSFSSLPSILLSVKDILSAELTKQILHLEYHIIRFTCVSCVASPQTAFRVHGTVHKTRAVTFYVVFYRRQS
jgi:hypothetical protein